MEISSIWLAKRGDHGIDVWIKAPDGKWRVVIRESTYGEISHCVHLILPVESYPLAHVEDDARQLPEQSTTPGNGE